MTDTIEAEILKLLGEISEEEKELNILEKEAINASREERSRNRYASKIRNCKDSLSRKMELLRSLKRN